MADVCPWQMRGAMLILVARAATELLDSTSSSPRGPTPRFGVHVSNASCILHGSLLCVALCRKLNIARKSNRAAATTVLTGCGQFADVAYVTTLQISFGGYASLRNPPKASPIDATPPVLLNAVATACAAIYCLLNYFGRLLRIS
jgi:hypothetical protein